MAAVDASDSPPPVNVMEDTPAVVAGPLDPEIASAVDEVDSQRILATVDTLVGFVTRNSCSTQTSSTEGIGAAREWIQQEFARIPGLQVAYDEYPEPDCATPVTGRNVFAWIPGQRDPSRLFIIGGHYDSRGSRDFGQATNATMPAPGANDSGSQTAVVLETARILASRRFDATIVFVAFSGEEQGLYGSLHFARNIASYFSAPSMEAMVACDIVGGDRTMNDGAALHQFRLYSPGTPREVGGSADQMPELQGSTDDTSPSRGLMRYIGFWGRGYVPSMAMLPHLREDRPGRGSDHQPFIVNRVPAARFIETIENTARQHSPDDITANMDPGYAARIARVVAASIGSLARAPSAPLALTVSGNLSDGVALSWSPPRSGAVDHYVIAARRSEENLYGVRIRVPAELTAQTFTAAALRLATGAAIFVSVAAVDAAGHESLFAYPEYRCAGDETGCVVQPGSALVTLTRNL